ncbi:MAG: TIM barrel protein [Rhodobacterales bacterium]|nr:TIM barrel protein [Rhodobacterales bacterium]
MRFSANLGFLFTDLPLPAAVRAAAAAGFDAVECHYPYAWPAADLRAVLDDTGLPLISLNTPPGDLAASEFGLAALPGGGARARAAVAQALDHAAAAGAAQVHVMAGRTHGAPGAEAAFRDTLDHACRLAAPLGIGILIEPLNPHDVPGYHLTRLDHAAAILADLDHANLRVLFDCYHVARVGEDVAAAFARHAAQVGHVQIAGVPDRGEPDTGTLDYARLLPRLAAAGWRGAVGAEYRPRGGDTAAGLGWLPRFRALVPG